MGKQYGFKVKADTKDAQAQIQNLNRRLKEFDKLAEKNRRINVNGTSRTSGSSRTSSVRTSSGSSSDGGLMGKIAGGNLMASAATAAGSKAVEYAPMLLNGMAQAIDKISLGALDAQHAMRNMFAMSEGLKKQMELNDFISRPQENAFLRGGQLGNLEDQQREHGTGDVAEEYAYQKAFATMAGDARFNTLHAQLASYVEKGRYSDNLDDRTNFLSDMGALGVSQEIMNSGNTWRIFHEMLKTYHSASEEERKKLNPTLQKIFGVRGMGVVRRADDIGMIESWVPALIDEFRRELPQEAVKATIKAQDETEYQLARAGIKDLKADPALITEYGIEQLKLSNQKAALLGPNREAVAGRITGETERKRLEAEKAYDENLQEIFEEDRKREEEERTWYQKHLENMTKQQEERKQSEKALKNALDKNTEALMKMQGYTPHMAVINNSTTTFA